MYSDCGRNGYHPILRLTCIFAGLGFSGMYISAMSVNMTNFSHSAHGSVSATIAGINWIGMSPSNIIFLL